MKQELKIGDLVRRKKGCGKHGNIDVEETFFITAINSSTAEDGTCNSLNQQPWRHSLSSLELVVEPVVNNTYPIF